MSDPKPVFEFKFTLHDYGEDNFGWTMRMDKLVEEFLPLHEPMLSLVPMLVGVIAHRVGSTVDEVLAEIEPLMEKFSNVEQLAGEPPDHEATKH